MPQNGKINYVELPAKDLSEIKEFFTEVFDWSFEDFGPEYCAFSNAGLDGGFYQSDLVSSTKNGAALIVFYTQELTLMEDKIKKAGGIIIKAIFSFPGGKRFHFSDPNGNEYAIWSDKA